MQYNLTWVTNESPEGATIERLTYTQTEILVKGLVGNQYTVALRVFESDGDRELVFSTATYESVDDKLVNEWTIDILGLLN